MGQLITDKAMQSKPSAKDRWLTETAKRGAGRLVGRVTPTGERLFYFRYTRADGKRDTLLIGSYAERPRAGAYTVAAARAKALEWSGLLDTADGAGTTIAICGAFCRSRNHEPATLENARPGRSWQRTRHDGRLRTRLNDGL
jgi:hypothetical protein